MGVVKTYNSKKVIVTFGGVAITGFSADSKITTTPAAQAWNKTVGCDSEVARGRSNDDTSEVTINLLQTSISNNYLATISNSDKLLGTGVLPLQITDLNGSRLQFWPQAWIRQDPDTDDGPEVGDRAWVFDTGQPAQQFIGGQVI